MIKSTEIHSESSDKEGEYLNGWQRSRAELDNLKKRMLQDKGEDQLKNKKEIVISLLSLIDNFHSMAKHVPDHLKEDPWTQGVLHIARQMDQILEDYGVETINAENEMFNPEIHEAIEEIKGKKTDKGKIVEVVQVGYKLGDLIIRPSKVKVAQ